MHCRRGGPGECEFGFERRFTALVGSEPVLDGADELRLGAACHVLVHFLAEECLEGLGELAGDGVGVVDEEPFEERLVELAAELVGEADVGGVAVLDEGERFGEVVLR